MKKEFIELARYRLDKAKNTLDDAKKYFVDATAESTVNRIYYAMFYAVNALLLTKGLAAAKLNIRESARSLTENLSAPAL